MVIPRPILIFPNLLGYAPYAAKQSSAREHSRIQESCTVSKTFKDECWLSFATLASLHLNCHINPTDTEYSISGVSFSGLWFQDLQVERYLLGAGLSSIFIEASRVSFSFDVLFLCANTKTELVQQCSMVLFGGAVFMGSVIGMLLMGCHWL